MAEKFVFVEFAENVSSPKLTFEIALPAHKSESSDLETITKAMILKKPSVFERFANNGTLIFKTESERFPGRFVDIGENSPVKDGSSILCVFVPKKIVDFPNVILEDKSNYIDNFQLLTHGNHSLSGNNVNL